METVGSLLLIALVFAVTVGHESLRYRICAGLLMVLMVLGFVATTLNFRAVTQLFTTTCYTAEECDGL
jgi:hypothetical protein